MVSMISGTEIDKRFNNPVALLHPNCFTFAQQCKPFMEWRFLTIFQSIKRE